VPKSDEGWNREAETDCFQKDPWLDWNECLVHVTMVYRRFRPIADHQRSTAAGQRKLPFKFGWIGVKSKSRQAVTEEIQKCYTAKPGVMLQTRCS